MEPDPQSPIPGHSSKDRYPTLLDNNVIDDPKGWRFSEKAKKGDLRIWQRVLSEEDEQILFQRCFEIKDTLTPELVNSHQTRRKSGGFGEQGYRYRYKDTTHEAKPWPPWLLKIRNTLQERLQQPLEFVLVNYFPDIDSGISEHCDNERDMKARSIIACISVGYSHMLRIVNAKSKKEELQIEIPSGSMYTMEGRFQEFLLHGVRPKPVSDLTEGKNVSENQFCRFSLTFRHLVPLESISHVIEINRKKEKRRDKTTHDHQSKKQKRKLTYKTRPTAGLGQDTRPGTLT